MTMIPNRTVSPPAVWALVLAFAVGAGGASARTWNVHEDGSGDAPTIQAAIDSAAAGDTVLVSPGVYTAIEIDQTGSFSAVDMKSGVALVSSGGPEVTVIEVTSEEVTRGATVVNCNPFTLIEGFTFTGGDAFSGAGILIDKSSLTVRNNIIFDAYGGSGGGMLIENAAAPLIVGNVFDSNIACCGVGGAMVVRYGAEPEIVDNLFVGNTGFGGGAVAIDGAGGLVEGNLFTGNSGTDGGALALYNSDATIRGNRFEGNESGTSGGAVAFFFGGTPLFEENLVIDNTGGGTGGGVLIEFASPVLRSNTIVGNHSSTGGGITIRGIVSPVIESNIVAFNIGTDAIVCDEPLASPTFACNNVFGNEGERYGVFCDDQTGTAGNVSVDPLFCGGGYELQECSPMIDGAGCGLVGALGDGCECGVTAVESASWGSVKSLFR